MTTDPYPAARWLAAPWIWDGEALHRDALLRLDGGHVGALLAGADAAEAAAALPAGAVQALPGQLLMPGLCDAHSHAFQRAFRGHVQHVQAGDSFWSWRAAMYATAARLDPEGVQAVSALAFLELLRAGVTAVGEFHYLHHDPSGAPYADPDELARRVIAAAAQVGIRITLLRVVYAAAGIEPDGSPTPPLAEQRRFLTPSPEAALAACARLRAANLGPLVRVGLAPHSVRAVPRAWLAELAGFEGAIHAHVAEQPAEVRACRAAFGCGPLQLLADAGLVDGRFSAVHLTHPEPGDAALLRDSGAGIVACPSTELDLGDGFLPPALHSACAVAVGSDSYADVDPIGEARALEGHARAALGRRVVLGDGSARSLPRRLLTMASQHGHAAIDQPGGRLRPGDVADLVSVDLDRPEADGVPPLEAVALRGRPEWVRHVWVAGEQRLRDRQHAAEPEIRAGFLATARA